MTQRASTCLSLLALLSAFPLSLGDATHASGSSLIGVSSVSEILDEFFKKQELAGRKPPVWKAEAQAMISLMQNLKGINGTTQEQVDALVQQIIDLLQTDVDTTKSEQETARTELARLKSTLETELGDLDSQLKKVKSHSTTSGTCRETVISLTEGFCKECSDNDHDDTPICSSSMSLLELGDQVTCPTECGKPSTSDFELTSEAKQTHTCDFEAGETAKECVAKLWGKVNLTRANLTNKYNAWAAKKKQCNDHRDRCGTCKPKRQEVKDSKLACDGKRDLSYTQYCQLQKDQNDFCSAEANLNTQWTTALQPAQSARESEYSDLTFIICIFEKYKKERDFTTTMVAECPRKDKNDYYTFAGGELVLPSVDSSAVPECSGTVSHSEGSPLFDMSGLIDEFKTDNYGTTVSVADHVYSPLTSQLPACAE